MSIKKMFLGLAIVAMMAVGVSASAQSAMTADQIVALLNANPGLAAQLLAALGGSQSTSTTLSTFNQDLTLGSTGSDVSNLQSILISHGFLAIASPTGTFGPLTKAAVMKWQASVGLPATGYFGPLSRAKLNGSMPAGSVGSNLPAGCTSAFGYSTTTGQSCAGGVPTVPGCTSTSGFSPTTGQACSGSVNPVLVADGSDGSVTISDSAFVSTGTQVKKGEMKNVLSTKLQAINGPVSVNRVTVKFSERPWLTLSQVQVKDGSGNVLASKALTGQSDATEVTVGTDYRVTFDNLNLVVRPGSDVHLVVMVTALASSDKITGQTVTVSIPSGGIRTVNGKGFSETVGPSDSFTYTLPSTGSNGDIYTSISPNSPLARFQTVAAGTTQTPNVTLGVYRVKSQNVSSTINNMSFNIKTSTGVATGTLFSNVRLETGSLSYGANSLTGGSTFTNLQIPLPQDQWVELTLKADVAGADTSSGVAASSTMVAASISGIDANFNSLTVSNGGNVTSSDVTFLQSGVGISNTSASIGTCNPAVANGPNVSCLATFTFTLQNTGNNVVYVSKTPGVTFATSTTPASVASSTITVLNASSPSDDSADTTASFAIQSGASRTFTGLGVVSQKAGTTGVHQLQIDRIYFGASASVGAQGAASTNASSYLSSGLGSLKATASF
jgi:peptidoglycan hydrolase-like protein with peptidoglycan-binding domain